MRIKVIVPITTDVFNTNALREFQQLAGGRAVIDVENLDYGPSSIESRYDDALAVPDILRKVQKAAAEGFDGVIIDCFGDPGVHAARELVDIPVVGAFEPSLLLAAGLGQELGILTILPHVVPTIKELAGKLGLRERLTSIRSVDIPVLELHDPNRLVEALYQQAVPAIANDGAHVLILGCTGMMGITGSLQARLRETGYSVPLIDPAFAAFKLVETYVSMGLTHSRLTYLTPPSKERKWWEGK